MNGKLRNMATIYIKKDKKFLLLDRIGSKVVDRSWCGVGGHFEPNELNDAKDAVLREMNEEIGITEKDLNYDILLCGLLKVNSELITISLLT